METSDDNNLVKKKWIIAGSVIGVLVLGVVIWVIMKYVVHHSHSTSRKAANQSDIGGVHFNNLTPSIPSGPTNNSHIEITAQDTRYNLGSKITVQWVNANYSKPVYWYFVGPSKKVLIKNHPGNIATNFVIPEEVSFIGVCKVVITDNYSTPTFSIHSSVFTTHVKLNFVNWNTTFYNKNVCKIGLFKDSKIDFSLYTITCYKDNKPFGQPIKAQSTSLSAGNSGNLELEFTPNFTEAQVSCNLLVTAQINGLTQTSGISSQTFTFKSKPAPSANKIVLTSKSGGDTFHVGDTVIIAITLPDDVKAVWSDVTALSITDNNGTTSNISPSVTKAFTPSNSAPHTIYGTWKLTVSSTATTFTMNTTVTVSGTAYTASTVQSYVIEQTLKVDNISTSGYTLNYWDKNSLAGNILPISVRTTFICTLSAPIVNTSTMTWTLNLIGSSTVTRTIIDSIVPNNVNAGKTQAVFQNTSNSRQFVISFWLDSTNPISITGDMNMTLDCVVDGITFTSPTYKITLSALKSYEKVTGPIIAMTPTGNLSLFGKVQGNILVNVLNDSAPNQVATSACNHNDGWLIGAWSFVFDHYDGDYAKGRIQATTGNTEYSNYYFSKDSDSDNVVLVKDQTVNIELNDVTKDIPTTKVIFFNDGGKTLTALASVGAFFPQMKDSTFIASIFSDYFYYKISGSYDHWFENVNYFKNPCTCALQGICTK